MTTSNQSFPVNPYQVVSLGIIMSQTLIGSLANGFMFLINLMDFASHGSLGSGDALLLCLGLSRFVFQWLLFTIYLLSFWFTDLAVLYIPKIIFSFLFFSSTSLWFATLLCSFYCVTLSKLNNCFFSIHKKDFDRWLPKYLLFSVAMSVIFSLPPVYVTFHNMGNWSISGTSSAFLFVRTNSVAFVSVSFLGSVLPFLVFCRAVIVLVVFLWKHVLKMKRQERTDYKEPSMQAYYRAAKALGSFFLFYSFYIVAFNLYISGIATLNNLIGCFCTMLIGSYPSVHSVFLILQNTKLQQALASFQQKIRCCSSPGNQTVTDPT
ncbi:hypothetical protein XENTR_v10017952 [Xenopus tropicalis]|uniref:Taste receptor type 2 n=1 Tax=Xenopus tropicalis TaxID=8364 RepID=Q2AB67_XENTR|nr:bitter taste receptor 15 [Xenopus tropicalis]KAE8590110.1 hypothetical protein XENTR_v10017952 [Xenopus tropicalis]BAE80400.1 bitter taste receptor [Xenopus tropicalis]|eukprot:NP_001165475.1 bitter taste receptor 15 [Xenopus tropicalis]